MTMRKMKKEEITLKEKAEMLSDKFLLIAKEENIHFNINDDEMKKKFISALLGIEEYERNE